MSRIATPSVQSATGATAEVYAEVRKATGGLPNTYAAIGALLRGNLWECSAMAEIRVAAQQLARRLATADEGQSRIGTATTAAPRADLAPIP